MGAGDVEGAVGCPGVFGYLVGGVDAAGKHAQRHRLARRDPLVDKFHLVHVPAGGAGVKGHR